MKCTGTNHVWSVGFVICNCGSFRRNPDNSGGYRVTPVLEEGRRRDTGMYVRCYVCQGEPGARAACQICGGKGKLWKRL